MAAVSDEVAHLLIDEPVGGGFVMLRQPRETRVSPCYMLTLRSRPLSPLARRLRELVLNQARAMPQLSMGE